MIAFREVDVRRAERLVLRALTLDISEPRVGIVGSNGSGKSTFLRLLNGLLAPTSGVVTVLGLEAKTDAKVLRRRVGFLFQNPDNQIVYPTVGEDLAFGLKKLKLGRNEESARVAAVLRRHAMAGFEDRLVHELSGGERQMVALAGVLVTEPDLLVLDEPTTLLDRRNRRRVMEAVEAAGRPVVMATHDLELLAAFDRVLVFEEGRIVHDDAPGPALDAYRHLAG